MHLPSRLFFVVFFLLVQLIGAQAQAIDLSVYALRYADDHKTVYLLNGDDEAVEIALSTARIVGPYHTVLDADSNVILRSKKEIEEGTVIYPPIAQAKLPSDIKEPVMILVPATESLPYQAIMIDQSLESFPVGSYLLVNLSPMDIRGMVGSNEVVVSSESVTAIIPSSVDEDLLDVHFQYERPTGWRTFARTRWVNDKNKRSLLLTYLDPKTKRMKIRGIPVKSLASTNE
jgi:hypothetical protein